MVVLSKNDVIFWSSSYSIISNRDKARTGRNKLKIWTKKYRLVFECVWRPLTNGWTWFSLNFLGDLANLPQPNCASSYKLRAILYTYEATIL